MIPENFKEALKLILQRLEGKQIDWAVYGSANLALQGLDLIPNDIDIITDKQGAFLFDEVFDDFVVKKAEYFENEEYKAFKASYHIEGVRVDVIGDLHQKNPAGDLWTETQGFKARMYFMLDGYELPVITLEQEFFAYNKLGKKEKAVMIKKQLDG